MSAALELTASTVVPNHEPQPITTANDVREDEPGVSVRPTFVRLHSNQTVSGVVEEGKPLPVTDGVILHDPNGVIASTGNIQDALSVHAYPPQLEAVETEVLESKNLRRLRMTAAFCALFLAGWNGGSTGAMLPYIERAYNINYAHVSILFVSTFVGYALAAAAAGPLSRRVGFGHALCISIIVELMGNIINSSQGVNFNLMCFGFFVVGCAFATQVRNTSPPSESQ
ncbi:hypothetical protein PHLCEN_2v4693 [Hermanssonia centrifuga]|uniref:Major facilitator superfamily (MFS) profile domain-containing protein n=1 Tax=Hermanssonia centrifuga TaxID=98765 RepID=A0A2R6PN05_9APHY|nr:hypothetical protein PHLCEN_2v4693 [Hermanssonia centrifuga]